MKKRSPWPLVLILAMVAGSCENAPEPPGGAHLVLIPSLEVPLTIVVEETRKRRGVGVKAERHPIPIDHQTLGRLGAGFNESLDFLDRQFNETYGRESMPHVVKVTELPGGEERLMVEGAPLEPVYVVIIRKCSRMLEIEKRFAAGSGICEDENGFEGGVNVWVPGAGGLVDNPVDVDFDFHLVPEGEGRFRLEIEDGAP